MDDGLPDAEHDGNVVATRGGVGVDPTRIKRRTSRRKNRPI
jgi:hypothetical protein